MSNIDKIKIELEVFRKQKKKFDELAQCNDQWIKNMALECSLLTDTYINGCNTLIEMFSNIENPQKIDN